MSKSRATQLGNGNSGIRVRVAVCALLALAVLATYTQVARFGFVDFDDPSYVYANPHVRTGLTAGNVAWALTAAHAGNWHPVTWVSHMVDVQFFGMSPGAHHTVNVLIHVINSWLLFLVLAGLTGSTWRAAFVAALFAVHPLNVESVAWISERKNVLSTTFWLLTIWAYANYARRGGIGRYGIVAVLFALGLAAKPMLVTLPIVLALLDVWPLRRGRGSVEAREGKATETGDADLPASSSRGIPHLADKLPLLALVAVSCWITMVVQNEGTIMRSLEQVPFGQRVANALVAYTAYVWKMVWPANLCVLYPHPKAGLPVWTTACCAIGLAAVTVWAVAVRGRRPYATVGWLWYLVTLVPVIGLVQVGPQAMADRYAYVPLMGLFTAIAWLVPELVGPRRSKWLACPAVAVLLALGISASAQVHYWKNSDELFTRALKVTGYHGTAFYCKAGTLADAGKVDQALDVLGEALKVSREPEVVHNFIGMLLTREGKLPEAIAHYRQAVKDAPRFAVGHNNLGTGLARQGKLREAELHLRRAVELKPNYAEAHHSLGVVLYWQGRKDKAIAEWRRALELNPGAEDTRRRLRQAGGG